MKKIYLVFLMSCFLNMAAAQESIMSDVSFSYLDKLIEIGKSYYPKFKFTTAKVTAAKAAFDKTKFGIFDFMSLSYVYLPGDYSTYVGNGAYSSSLNGYQLGVFINVGTILEKPSIIKEAKQEYVAAKLDKDVIDLDVEQEIRRRYFVYVEQSNILKLKAKSMADADDVLKNIKYKFEKGEVTFDIYNQTLLTCSTYSEAKITAEANLLIAKTSLEEILGTKLENIK